MLNGSLLLHKNIFTDSKNIEKIKLEGWVFLLFWLAKIRKIENSILNWKIF